MHALTTNPSHLAFTFPHELILSFQYWVKDQIKKQSCLKTTLAYNFLTEENEMSSTGSYKEEF